MPTRRRGPPSRRAAASPSLASATSVLDSEPPAEMAYSRPSSSPSTLARSPMPISLAGVAAWVVAKEAG